MGQTPAGSIPARAEEGLSPDGDCPIKRLDPAASVRASRPQAGYALRHLPNTSPPKVNPSPAASLAMPLKRPADSLGRPLDSFGPAELRLAPFAEHDPAYSEPESPRLA